MSKPLNMMNVLWMIAMNQTVILTCLTYKNHLLMVAMKTNMHTGGTWRRKQKAQQEQK